MGPSSCPIMTKTCDDSRHVGDGKNQTSSNNRKGCTSNTCCANECTCTIESHMPVTGAFLVRR